MSQLRVFIGIGMAILGAVIGSALGFALSIVVLFQIVQLGGAIERDPAEGFMFLTMLIGAICGACFGVVRTKSQAAALGRDSPSDADRWLRKANAYGLRYWVAAPLAFALGLLLSAILNSGVILFLVVNPLVVVTALGRAAFVALTPREDGRELETGNCVKRFLLSLCWHTVICFPPSVILGFALTVGGGVFYWQ